jgi:hypothetical protein
MADRRLVKTSRIENRTEFVRTCATVDDLGLLGKARPEFDHQRIFFVQYRAKDIYSTGDLSSNPVSLS